MTREHIILDGYNVVFQTPLLSERVESTSLEAARADLVRWLEEAFRGRRERVTVVFDGERDAVPPGTRRRGGIHVCFSTPPENADALIGRLVEEERRRAAGKHRLACRVVTSDAEVARHARLCGAKAIAVDGFVRGLRAGPGGATRAASGRVTGATTDPALDRRRGRRRQGSAPAGTDASADPGARARPPVGSRRELDEYEKLFRRRRAGEGENRGDEEDGED